MSLFDEIKGLAGAAEQAFSEHPDQVKTALVKLGEAIDEQTGGAHHDQIIAAETKGADYIDRHGRPPASPPGQK